MDKNRSTSRLTNVITVNTATDDISVPAQITIGADPGASDSTQKVATTNWVTTKFIKTLTPTAGSDLVANASTGAGATATIDLTLKTLVGLTAGTYNNSATSVRPFDIDTKGRITAIGTAVTITPAWSSITSKPTTISGYAISDFWAQTLGGNYAIGTNTAIAGTDTLEVMLEKLQGQISARQPLITGSPGYVKLTGASAPYTVSYVTAIGNADLANSTISGIPLGTNLANLTFSSSGNGDAAASTYNGGTARIISYNSIGAQPLATNLTSLAGLTFASTSFVKMTAAGTFALDTNTYLTATTGVTSISFVNTGLTPNAATSGAITVAGTLNVATGGTGANTLTGVVIGNGTGAMTATSGTGGQLLRRNAGNTGYEFFTPTYISSYTETDTLSSVTGRGATTTTNISLGGGSTSLNNATSNIITWGTAGVAAPAFSAYSAGVKLVLYDNVGAASAGYTIGISSSTMFFTTDTTGSGYRWTGGTTTAMTLSGTGNLVTTGSVTASSIIKSGGTSSQFLKANGDVDSNVYLTAESDTLATVTGRGATTSTAVTFNGGITTSTLTTTGNVTIGGNVTINGTTTTINATTLTVDDTNIVLGDVASPTNVTADGGGITLKGATDKTFNWVSATGAWTSSEDMNLLTGKVYEINGTTVLSATALGSGVTGSSLTSVGTISTGTWQATAVAVAYGGTGATTAAGARTNLGLAIGSNVQAWDGDLDAIAALAGNSGFLKKTAANTWTLDTNTYLTSFTETDPTVPSHVKSITTTQVSNWDTAYTDRNKWDGGATGLVAATGRTSLGATTVGSNFFTATNPSAVTFPKVNADNTITFESAATHRASIGAGTVTSVALSSGIGLSVGAAITSSGTINVGATSDNIQINSLGVGRAASATAGRIDAAGDIVGFSTSDIRLKKDITILDNASKLLSKLRGVSYVWDEQSKDVHGYSGKDYGVIAQDVEKVFPEMIQHRDNGYMAVRYERLIGVLVAAVNELSARVEQLESK